MLVVFVSHASTRDTSRDTSPAPKLRLGVMTQSGIHYSFRGTVHDGCTSYDTEALHAHPVVLAACLMPSW